jgi:hypothetical protein
MILSPPQHAHDAPPKLPPAAGLDRIGIRFMNTKIISSGGNE